MAWQSHIITIKKQNNMRNRGIIVNCGHGIFSIPSEPVWMTMQEIADLFWLFGQDVRKQIHTIYKNQELYESETHKYVRQDDGISYDVFNLQMVIALAFRINSQECRLFRKFIMDKICRKEKQLQVFFECKNMPGNASC